MKTIAIFAGYDKNNIIEEYVIYYIKELKKIADIIYVSDCNMKDQELKKINEYCIHIINGRHEEYDFGSYKRGYLYAKENNIIQNYDYLILCNDSCYGPFFNLENIIENLESKNTDVCGLFRYLKDNKVDEHLQSYFLLIKQKVFISDWFDNFINNIKKEKTKDDIIKKYEIGLSKLFMQNNCSISSFLDSSSLLDRNENNLPSTNSCEIIKMGFPFLKSSIFNNPTFSYLNINKIYTIFDIIKNNYNINYIINHLNKVADKNNIKYLFPRFKTKKTYIFSEKIIKINFQYSVSGRFQILFLFFSKLKITVDFPKNISYIDHKYKDFNFLLEEMNKK